MFKPDFFPLVSLPTPEGADGVDTAFSPNSGVVIDFGPDNRISVHSDRFTIRMKESSQVNGDFSSLNDSKSYPDLEREQPAPDECSTEHGDSMGDGAQTHVLITRSMTEISRTELDASGHGFHQQFQGSMYTANERVLDTPAVQTRYRDAQAPSDASIQIGSPHVDSGELYLTAPTTEQDEAQKDPAALPQSLGDLSTPAARDPDVPGSRDEVRDDSASRLQDDAHVSTPDVVRHEAEVPSMTTTPSTAAELRVDSRASEPAVASDLAVAVEVTRSERPRSPSIDDPAQVTYSIESTKPQKRKRPTTYATPLRRAAKRKLEVLITNEGEDEDEANDIPASPPAKQPCASRPVPNKRAKRAPKEKSPKTVKTPTAANKPKRSVVSKSSPSKYEGPGPRIAFSNSKVPDQPKVMRFLRDQHAKKVEAVSPSTDLVCVGDGELKRTSKLTLAVVLGKNIVTDRWAIESHSHGHLLDPSGYLPSDPESESKWRFGLAAAIERGKAGVKVFDGWTVYFTPTLLEDSKEAARELAQLAQTAGAKTVMNRLPRESPAESGSPSRLIIGAENDEAALALSELGWRLYSKDIVSLSILRGCLNTDEDEFRIKTPSLGRAVASARKKAR